MRLRRRAWMKLLALALSGGTLFQLGQNCSVFGNQFVMESINWSWFLTCDTDTLFSGANFLLDCINGSSTPTATDTTTGLGI